MAAQRIATGGNIRGKLVRAVKGIVRQVRDDVSPIPQMVDSLSLTDDTAQHAFDISCEVTYLNLFLIAGRVYRYIYGNFVTTRHEELQEHHRQ